MTDIAIRGNLVRPIELRFTSTGKAVGNASVAVNRGRDDRKETDYYEVVLWEDLAQNAAELEKGTSVIVLGRLTSRQFETKDGSKRTVWEVTADAFGPDLRFQTVTVARDGGSGGRSQSPVTDDTWSVPSGAETGAQQWATAPAGGADYGDSTPF